MHCAPSMFLLLLSFRLSSCFWHWLLCVSQPFVLLCTYFLVYSQWSTLWLFYHSSYSWWHFLCGPLSGWIMMSPCIGSFLAVQHSTADSLLQVCAYQHLFNIWTRMIPCFCSSCLCCKLFYYVSRMRFRSITLNLRVEIMTPLVYHCSHLGIYLICRMKRVMTFDIRQRKLSELDLVHVTYLQFSNENK